MMKKLFLFLVMLLWAGGAGATYPSYTVCPSGCDYNTLNGAVADLEANHATPASPVTITISGSWVSNDSAPIYITSALTLSSSNTLTITTTGAARNNTGVYSTSFYRLYDDTYQEELEISTPYVTVDGLQVVKNLTGYDGISIGSGNCVIKNNIILQQASGGTGIQRFGATPSTSISIYNNVVYGFGAGILAYYYADDVVSVYNNTVYGNTTYGISTYSNTIYKNNISYNNGTDYTYGGSLGTHSNNLSKDATSPDASYQNQTLTFVNAGADNFNLVSSDTGAIGNGVNLSGTFTTDILGKTRTVPWDIGAFKYVSASVNHGFTRFLN